MIILGADSPVSIHFTADEASLVRIKMGPYSLHAFADNPWLQDVSAHPHPDVVAILAPEARIVDFTGYYLAGPDNLAYEGEPDGLSKLDESSAARPRSARPPGDGPTRRSAPTSWPAGSRSRPAGGSTRRRTARPCWPTGRPGMPSGPPRAPAAGGPETSTGRRCGLAPRPARSCPPLPPGRAAAFTASRLSPGRPSWSTTPTPAGGRY